MDIHRRIVEFIDGARPFVVALILMADGSTPRKAGVRAIIDRAGRIWGTLGGGQVEAEAQRRAPEVCDSRRPFILELNLDGACAKGDTPICGGAMRILLDPTAAANRAAYAQAAKAMRQRQRGVLLTTVRPGAEPEVALQWCPEEGMPPEAGFPGAEAIRSCLSAETPRLFVDESKAPEGRKEVLVEPVVPRPLLLIAGGGHIGQALAHQAVPIGFDVTVIDDRPDFTDAALFPAGVAARCGSIAQELAACDINEETYVVVVTRGHRYDAEALAACIHSPAAYVGMVGSRRKVAMIRKGFIEAGVATEAELDRVFAPIGLDIGAVTVPEIATSIAAQLVAVRRKGPGCPPPGHMTQR